MNSPMGNRPGGGPHGWTAPFAGVGVGDRFGPTTFEVSAPANDRYWDAAGIDHAARRAGVLYPPMAANLTILAFQTVAPDPLLHTAQTLRGHTVAHAPATVSVTGRVTGRFTKRGREYVEVTAELSADGVPWWTSVATFVEAGA